MEKGLVMSLAIANLSPLTTPSEGPVDIYNEIVTVPRRITNQTSSATGSEDLSLHVPIVFEHPESPKVFQGLDFLKRVQQQMSKKLYEDLKAESRIFNIRSTLDGYYVYTTEKTQEDLEWDIFLSNYPLDSEKGITSKVIESLVNVKSQFESFLGKSIHYPSVYPAEEEGLELTWELENYFLNIEIFERDDQICLYWFAKSKKNDGYMGEESLLSDGFPPEQLSLFVKEVC